MEEISILNNWFKSLIHSYTMKPLAYADRYSPLRTRKSHILAQQKLSKSWIIMK